MRTHNLGWWIAAGVMAVSLVGGVSAANLVGPLSYAVTLQGKTVHGDVILGPGGPYVSARVIDSALGAQAHLNTSNKTLLFTPTSPSPSTPKGYLLQTMPASAVFAGGTGGWRWITPATPVTTVDNMKFTAGVLASYSCNGNNTPGVTFGPTYLTNGQYSALTFSLGLPAFAKNAPGSGAVEVFAGNSLQTLSLIYNSPKVSKGFFTQKVTVRLPNTRLVRVVTVLNTSCNHNSDLHGLVMGNAEFLGK